MDLKRNYKLSALARSENIYNMLTKEDRESIANHCFDGFKIDENSRLPWLTRTSDSMKLALQAVEQKSFPWAGASNVKFPLVTIAALQFHSRAYPMLVSGTEVVKMRVVGQDPDGTKAARAYRVGSHMSYQVLEEDEAWEEEMDKVLIHTPIVGCSFKKVFYDHILGHNVSQFVPASDLVVNYWATSLEQAQRVTHMIPMSQNDIYEQMAAGYFAKTDLTTGQLPVLNEAQQTKDMLQRVTAPANNMDGPIDILEQHTWLDLDGDGYREPYIVYIRRDNKQLLRIETRFNPASIKWNAGRVVKIKPEVFFTKYPFIPSPDGGFYDLGFGSLLGPVNESINTLINQLIDAGTMSNTAGGFLSRGVKIRGGATTFAPLEWKHVETSGQDLKNGIFPLPVREPSQVLFTLLSLLISYGERIGMATEALVGENPGQNTPAETSRNMSEQGLKIFSGIFKRTYRALRDEFRMLYHLNKLHMDEEVKFGDGKSVTLKDYLDDAGTIVPVADPNVVSDQQRLSQAMMVKQSAMQTPGYDRYKVERFFLNALKVPNVDELLPDPKGPNAVAPPKNPKVEIETMKVQQKAQADQLKAKMKSAELMQKAQKQQAEIEKLQAEAMKLMKEAQTADTTHAIQILQVQMKAQEAARDDALELAKIMMDLYQFEESIDEPEDGTARPAK